GRTRWFTTPGSKTGPGQFRSRLQRRVNQCACSRIADRTEQRLDRVHLGDRQARLSVRALAQEDVWLEVAATGIANEAILQSVVRIARAKHGFVNEWDLVRWNR